MPMSSVRRLVPLLLAAACWGVGTVITKQVLDTFAPLVLLPLQLMCSCLFLAILILIRRDHLTWSPTGRRLSALGVLNPGLAYALGLVGLGSISASMSVLLWAAEPVLILLLAVAWLRESVPRRLAVALGAALLGVGLVVYQPGATGDVMGIVLTLSAVACCAFYAVLTRRLLVDAAALPVVLAQQLAALLFALLVAATGALAGLSVGVPVPLAPGPWLAAAVGGVVYYGLAFWLFILGLKQVNAAVAGALLPLVPVFGLAGGYVVGDRLSPMQWAGAAVVVAITVLLAVGQGRDDDHDRGSERSCEQLKRMTPPGPGLTSGPPRGRGE